MSRWDEYERELRGGKDPFYDFCIKYKLNNAILGISGFFEYVLFSIATKMDIGEPGKSFRLLVKEPVNKPNFEKIYKKSNTFLNKFSGLTELIIDLEGNEKKKINTDDILFNVEITFGIIIVKFFDKIIWINYKFERREIIKVISQNDIHLLYQKFKSEIIDAGFSKGVYYHRKKGGKNNKELKNTILLFSESELLNKNIDFSLVKPVLVGEDICQAFLGMFLYYFVNAEVIIEAQRGRNRPDIIIKTETSNFIIEVKVLGKSRRTNYGMKNIYDGIYQILEYQAGETKLKTNYYSIAVFDVCEKDPKLENILAKFCNTKENFKGYPSYRNPFWKIYRFVPLAGGFRGKSYRYSGYSINVFP